MNDIESVIAQLERQRGAIDRALSALREIVGTAGSATTNRGTPPAKKRPRGNRRMSAEGRARIAEATRKRWAAKRATEEAAAKQIVRPAKKVSGGKRSISPEGRARIAEAARRMWASKKAAKKTPRKKAVAGESAEK